MVRARLQGINSVSKRLKNGERRLYHYHRSTNTRLPGEPGSPEFLAAYAAAERSLGSRLQGTLSALLRAYLGSPEFGKRAESTQREYRRMLARVEERFGNMPLAAIEDPRVKTDFLDWRAKVSRESGEREGDNRLSVLSAMLTWGVDNGRLVANHISGFKRLHKADRSDLIWLPEHIAAFMAVAPIELQRAMILALHTGQRQGDILRLAWSNYDGAWIRLRQGKGGTRVELPCTRALQYMLDGLDRRAAVILTTTTGRPWKARYFKSKWEQASRAAGITDLHFHDLRGTAVTMLAEAGCTTPQIAAITGHSLRSVTRILDTYLSRTKELAGEAMRRFENASSTEFANRLQTSVGPPSDGSPK